MIFHHDPGAHTNPDLIRSPEETETPHNNSRFEPPPGDTGSRIIHLFEPVTPLLTSRITLQLLQYEPVRVIHANPA